MRDGAPLAFTKMQAVGNDFVVLDAKKWPSDSDTDWVRQAIRLCDRRFGVGADGLMVWGPSNKADLQARMWNPDGTEDMCGNGTRCVLHHARASASLPLTGTIETLSGIRAYRFNPDDTITVEMGTPKFAPADIPITCPSSQGLVVDLPFGSKVLGDAVNTGSTHLVCYLNPMDIVGGRFWEGRGAAITNEPFTNEEWFQVVSPHLETHPWFPERTSIMWTQVEDPNTLRLRIWERGAGETLGCGTGACAAAVRAKMRRLVGADGDVTVHSKGGTLRVGWAGGENDPMYLTGTAHITYTGVVDGED